MGTRSDILELGSRSLFLHIITSYRPSVVEVFLGRLYTENQTKRMLYRKSFVSLHPKAYEV